MTKVSRRQFALTAAALAGADIRRADGAAMTAREVMARIQAGMGEPSPARTVDGFKAGNPETAVKGIATTAMATMEVLQQAAKQGLNLVVTFESVFFGQSQPMPPGRGPGGRGQPGLGPDDPAYRAKQEFIEKNGMAVFRLRDQWTARSDNPLAAGLGEALGWSAYQVAGDPTSYRVPSVKLETLVAGIRKRLNLRAGLRVVGDRQTVVRSAAVVPGAITIETALNRLPSVDLLIGGQSQEWDVAEYAFDTVAAGSRKGYIMLGVVVSEDLGMRVCSRWIQSVVKEMPVEWIGVGDPYWRPA